MKLRHSLCLLLGMHCFSAAQAELKIEEQTFYYEFYAESRKEIWNEIIRLSPRGLTNVAGHHAVNVAVTEWSLASNYMMKGGLQRCTVKSVEPTLTITIRLPYWINKWEADPVLAENWDNYVRMVSDHEDIHRQYAIKMAEEYEQAVLELGSFRRCEELEEAVTKLRDKIVGKYQAKNKWFDAKEYTYQKELEWF